METESLMCFGHVATLCTSKVVDMFFLGLSLQPSN